MTMIDPTKFLPALLAHEGSTTWIYRDTVGYATVGIGNLLHDADDAAALPFYNATEGRPATPDEIRREFVRVMSCQRGMRASAYRAIKLTPRIELTAYAVNELALRRLATEFLPGIRKLCPGFDAFPGPAQECLTDRGILESAAPRAQGNRPIRLPSPRRATWGSAEAAEHCRVSTCGRTESVAPGTPVGRRRADRVDSLGHASPQRPVLPVRAPGGGASEKDERWTRTSEGERGARGLRPSARGR
jgi:hypothetical protein